MSSRYTPIGVEPVASPSTIDRPNAERSRMSDAMRPATSRAIASCSSMMIVGIRSRTVPSMSGCTKMVPLTRTGPLLDSSVRACEPSVATGEPEAMVITGGIESSAQAENELPQPQPPVEFGFLKVKPDPCIDVT